METPTKAYVNKTLLFVQSRNIVLKDILLHTHRSACSVCMKLWLVHFTAFGFLLFHFVVKRVCGVATSKLINQSITQYICTNFTGLSVVDSVSDCLKELCLLMCVSSVGVRSHQFYLNFVVPVHRKSNTLAHIIWIIICLALGRYLFEGDWPCLRVLTCKVFPCLFQSKKSHTQHSYAVNMAM